VTALVAALTDEFTSTSDLYDRVGYPALVRLGLVAYADFRAALVALETEGVAVSGTDDEGATTWRRSP
jgi:hypothetical protein